MSAHGTPTPSVDDVEDLIKTLDQQGKPYAEIAAAVHALLNRPIEQDDTDDTDLYRIRLIRAAFAVAAIGALGLITGWALAVAAVWSTTLHDQLQSTALLAAGAGALLIASTVLVVGAVPTGDAS